MYAQAHGFNSINQWVTYQSGINSTPPTATGSGSSNYWITYRVVQKVPQMFSAILGDMSGMVASRSTAAIQGATDCIYALNPNQSGAISVGGTASLTSACGIYDNSSDPCALSTNGGGTITAPEYDVVGNACTHAALTPAANAGVSHITDPMAGLATPASAPYTCDVKNYKTSKDDTISQGVYCGGIQVQKGLLTMNPGTYILVGGGIYTQDANSNTPDANDEGFESGRAGATPGQGRRRRRVTRERMRRARGSSIPTARLGSLRGSLIPTRRAHATR
jgi:hypothetical protein